ncbi:MAG: hypothetical protein Q9220_001078 [cf. Caloplaca sp. 1 TL-2023]
MGYSVELLTILLLLANAIPSSQLDITIEWWPVGLLGQLLGNYQVTCSDIPPGECCIPHPALIPSPGEVGLSQVNFGSLLQNQLGAGWASQGPAQEDVANCSGMPVLHVMGPQLLAVYQVPEIDGWVSDTTSTDSTRSAFALPDEMVFTASWVDLRTRFPPDSADARYLQFQGVKSLVWGTNTWSAASDGIPFPKRSRKPRLNGWAQRGKATIASPAKRRYPSSYSINGTVYSHFNEQIYRSRAGKILDMARPLSKQKGT